MVLSCGALLGRDDLFEMARRNGATIVVPSGAIVGLDGVVSASAGRIESVTMVTRKPPDGLRGSPGALSSDVDLDALTEPALLYEGPVEVACRLFPANVNVSAALSLAGIGPKKTTTRVLRRSHRHPEHPRDNRGRRVRPVLPEDRERALALQPPDRAYSPRCPPSPPSRSSRPISRWAPRTNTGPAPAQGRIQ